MDIHQLQERVVKITNEMVQCKALYSKLEGHLAETRHWLTELVKAAQEPSGYAVMDSLPQDTEEQGNGETHEQTEGKTAEV